VAFTEMRGPCRPCSMCREEWGSPLNAVALRDGGRAVGMEQISWGWTIKDSETSR